MDRWHMSTFTDTSGRTWSLRLTIGKLRRIVRRGGPDYLAIAESFEFGELLSTPGGQIDALLHLTHEERLEQGVSDADFEDSLPGGDAHEAAMMAVLGELANFIPSPKAKILRELIAAYEAEQRNRNETLDAMVAAGTIRQTATEALKADTGPGEPSTSSPGSSASIPTT